MQKLIAALIRLVAQTPTNEIKISNSVQKQLEKLRKKDPQTYEKSIKAINLLKENSRHPSLQTHEFRSEKGPDGEKILRSAITQTSGGWRMHWYQPKAIPNTIYILDILKHE